VKLTINQERGGSKMRTLTAILLSIFFVLSGCATSSYSTGRDFDSSSVNQIIKGETTRADLLQMLGQPFSKTVMSENEEKWIYMYSSGTAKAQSYVFTMKVESTGRQKMLDILLRDGIVTNYTYNEGPTPGSLNVR
jgi:outer membrane protein assembly factor BamE (lipoprotein component of BamABCDE complex)